MNRLAKFYNSTLSRRVEINVEDVHVMVMSSIENEDDLVITIGERDPDLIFFGCPSKDVRIFANWYEHQIGAKPLPNTGEEQLDRIISNDLPTRDPLRTLLVGF